MKTALLAIATLLAFASSVSAATRPLTITINEVSPEGIGASIGTVEISESAEGLVITPKLHDLPPGPHGFHLHEKPNCAAAEKDGKMTAAQAAGDHWDPNHTGKHAGPRGSGHAGDLPVLEVAQDGSAEKAVTMTALKISDIRGKALMIHEDGDNYSDSPKPLGGGGARIACGVIPTAS